MSRKIDPRFPPKQFNVSTYEPVIIVQSLSEEDRDSLWEHLKVNHRNIAKSISGNMKDPFVQLLMCNKNGLGALLAIELKYVPDHLKKYQLIF